MTANFIGFIVLAALSIVVPLVSTVRIVEWFALFLMLSAVSIYVWNQPWSPKEPTAWMKFAGKTVLLAVIAFSCLRIGSWLLYSGQTEAPGSLTIDFVLAACISPGLTAIAIAGATRAKYLHWTAERSAKQ